QRKNRSGVGGVVGGGPDGRKGRERREGREGGTGGTARKGAKGRIGIRPASRKMARMKRYSFLTAAFVAAFAIVPQAQMRVVPIDDEQGHVALGLALRHLA